MTTLTGGSQELTTGPVASQEAIKELGTNGGGFFNVNSAHPFENPTAFTNIFEIFLILVIPLAMALAFGHIVKDRRQGITILSVMVILLGVSIALLTWAEMAGPGSAPELAGGAMEGKEVRFGTAASALFGAATTGTSTGAVNSMHDSFTAPGGGVALFNMMLGEIAPGGVGAGLYGMLMLAVVTVFLSGLMVGRTPEYLGKKIGQREIVMVALYVLTTPVLVLVGSAIALTGGRRPGRTAGLRSTRALRGGVRRHVGVQQQRQRVRGPDLGNAVLEHAAGPVHAARPLRADRVRAGPGRTVLGAATAAAQCRNPAHPPATVRGPPQRRRPGRGRPDLRARARPRSDRGVAVVNLPKMQLSLTEALPGAFRKLDPRELAATPVMLVVEIGAVATTVLSIIDPSTLGWMVTVWLWLTVLFGTLAESVAEGRGKAQAASLRALQQETTARRVRGSSDQLRSPATWPSCPPTTYQAPRCAPATWWSSRPASASPATATSSRASPRSTSPR